MAFPLNFGSQSASDGASSFSNMLTGSNTNPNQQGSFSGLFGQPSTATGMTSSIGQMTNPQSSSSMSVFGMKANPVAGAPSTGLGLFGQASQTGQAKTGMFNQLPASGGLFGQTGSTGGGLFGQSSGNLFGQTQSTQGFFAQTGKGGVLGQSSGGLSSQSQEGMFSQAASAGVLLGQTSQTGMFGQAGATPLQLGQSLGQSLGGQTLGGQTLGQPTSGGGLFGQTGSTGMSIGQTSQTGMFGQSTQTGMFGQSAQTGMFGQTLAAGNLGASTSLFGQQPSGGGLLGQPQSSGGLFGQLSASTGQLPAITGQLPTSTGQLSVSTGQVSASTGLFGQQLSNPSVENSVAGLTTQTSNSGLNMLGQIGSSTSGSSFGQGSSSLLQAGTTAPGTSLFRQQTASGAQASGLTNPISGMTNLVGGMTNPISGLTGSGLGLGATGSTLSSGLFASDGAPLANITSQPSADAATPIKLITEIPSATFPSKPSTEATALQSVGSSVTASLTSQTSLASTKTGLGHMTSSIMPSTSAAGISASTQTQPKPADVTSEVTADDLQKASLESLQHERIKDILDDWDQRLEAQCKEFERYSDVIVQTDLNLFDYVTKIQEIYEGQNRFSANQKVIDVCLDQFENQYNSVMNILDKMESQMLNRSRPIATGNYGAGVEGHSLRNKAIELAAYIDEMHRENDEVSLDLEHLQSLMYPYSIRKLVLILNMRKRTLDGIEKQLKTLKNDVESVEKLRD